MYDKVRKIKSVDKAMELLTSLGEEGRSMSLAELSVKMRMPKSTIHGMLSTMRDRGLIDQCNDGKYCLGHKLVDLGHIASSYGEHSEDET